MTFPTTWYFHSSAPEFFICSWCFVEHIYTSRFQDQFVGTILNDEKPRECLFSRPRMNKVLFPDATSTGSLQGVLEWMKRRSAIPKCKGVDGAKGAAGVKWYSTIGNEINGFVACEACYEDICLTNSFASHLEPTPNCQAADDVWFCDMAVRFVQGVYTESGKTKNWTNFVTEAEARMNRISSCPKGSRSSGSSRAWFRPKNRDPGGLVICAACYCDHVGLTADSSAWERATELDGRLDINVTCDMGQFNLLIAMLRAVEREDYSIWWTAVREVARQPHCDSKGVKDGVWYTLPSRPAGFEVCGACYAAVLRSLDIERFFVRRSDIPPGESRLCSLHPSYQRFQSVVNKLLETFYLQDTARLERWAVDYADTPICGRDKDFKDRVWYGWEECTICPECYLEFIKGTSLAGAMPLRGARIPQMSLCEMYSPRMRQLYLEACETGDPSQLLEHATLRRRVYFETVPPIRAILFRAQMRLGEQVRLNAASTTYKMMGGLEAIGHTSHYTYGNAAVGYGHENLHSFQGAVYGQQGMEVFRAGQMQGVNDKFVIKELEERWRAVE
ncbi:Integral membrane protein [Pleurostoma richardsiae]|uniref:Integral membrane protein n=1 Tax=Pleurostoma richardsiae TaxID=41990 RepID=A0AA38RRJ8_9PEZI|nr:Integral membrane protein [Pleurostoma richardsiae]